MSLDTDRIRRAADVPRLYRELFPQLCRGNASTVRCFRDDAHARDDASPSMQLHLDGYKCHGCGTRGDAIGLVMAAQRCDFRQALAWLADRLNLDVMPAVRGPAPWNWPDFTPPQIAMLYRLWELVRDLAPTPAAKRWLASRGVTVEIAWALGCRDWSPRRKELLALVAADPQIATSLRLLVDGKLWWPMRDPTFVPGVVVPAFVPGLAVPCAWRWRFCEAVERGGRLVKSAAQPGAQPVPLGVHVTDGSGTVVGAAECRILVVAEGEPDWLSFHDAAAGCVGVLGLCEVSGGWRSAYSTLLRDKSLLVVATHKKDGDPIGHAVGAAMADLYRDAKHRLVRVNLAEARDGNDLHREGALLPLLARVLKEKQA